MSDALSAQLLATLRSQADDSARPKQRHATLDRLLEACNDILSGHAEAIVKRGLPGSLVHFRRRPIVLIPMRIQEYVEARFAIDVGAGRQSAWTGPKDLTIRKDESLYNYVRVRAQEHAAANPGKLPKDVDRTLDQVEDLALRAELRFVLAHARRAVHDLRRLKDGMRRLRPTVDVEAIIKGCVDDASGRAQPPQSVIEHPWGSARSTHAVTAVMKLQNPKFLAKCGLEFSPKFGNVVELRTRFELITSEELRALRDLTGLIDA